MALFATATRVAQLRVQSITRRAALRGGLIGGCILVALIFLGFGLAAATAALADHYGTTWALAIMAGGTLLVLVLLLAALSIESRRHRRIAARRAQLDRQLLQSAALAMMPARAHPRGIAGIALVAAGALLILARSREPREPPRSGDD